MSLTNFIDGTKVHQKTTLITFRHTLLKHRLNQKKHTYLACGSIRGGTSILGYVLDELNIIKGDNIHPTTHEDLDFENNPSIEKWSKLIEERNDKNDIWGLKLPEIAKTLPFFEKETINPIFLVIMRNPIDLTMSILKRDHRTKQTYSDLNKAFEIGNKYYQSFFESLPEINSPFILLKMEKIYENPELFLDELKEELNVTIPSEQKERIISKISTPGYKKK